MICKIAQVILAALLISIVLMPVSAAFGSIGAIMFLLIGLAYVTEE